MKIIQLLARIEGSGVTRYIIELNKALKSIGHDVELAYINPMLENDNPAYTGQTVDCNIYEWGTDTIQHFNSADLVIINSIIDAKSPMRYTWINLVTKKITTKKVIVVNDHKPTTFRCYYGDLLKNAEFWQAFDKICTFSYDSKVYEKIRNLIGEEAATKKYLHLLHPYEFNDNFKSTWKVLDNKYKRVCYLGRHATFKDDWRLLRACKYFWEHDYELEMRGLHPTIHTTTIPDFKYVLDPVTNKPIEKVPYVRGDKYVLSPYTYWCDDGQKWRKERGYKRPSEDSLMTIHREKNRIYIFGAYKHDEGLEIISNYMFGCNFYNLDNNKCYGNNWEYTVFEMVERGVIPLLDYNAGESIHIIDESGKFGNSFLDTNAGIFLKKDLSNIEDVLNLMDRLSSDKYLYNTWITHIYNIMKQHTNPQVIAKKLIDDITK